MKAILMMVISSDGYIARPNDEAPWSPQEFARCNEFAHNLGNVIIGRKTYALSLQTGDIDTSISTVVLSNTASDDVVNVHFASSPQAALDYLALKKMTTAVIGGGTKTNSAFLNANLIDEIIIDVEPIILGNGFRLFEQQHEDIKLKLLETKKFDDGAIRLHYSLIK